MKLAKKLLAVFFALAMLAGFCVGVFADDGSVSYMGNAENFIFAPGGEESPTDLFNHFKDVMPGDSLTQKIFVKNELKNNVKIKVFVRSLGAQQETNEFLSKLKLTVTQDGESNLFEAPADQTAQLTEWTYLGLIFSGGEITLDVKLDVPTDLDNKFQGAVGYVDWEFRVEELPVDPDDPKPPQTGDESHVWLYVSLLAVCFAVILIIFIVQKKRKKED